MKVDYESIVKEWQSRKIASLAELDTVLANYRILFAYHSNQIENTGLTYHQTREVFENGKVLAYTGDPRKLFEAQNQKVCYEFLREKTVQKRRLHRSLSVMCICC